jgi:hypothetical protein
VSATVGLGLDVRVRVGATVGLGFGVRRKG